MTLNIKRGKFGLRFVLPATLIIKTVYKKYKRKVKEGGKQGVLSVDEKNSVKQLVKAFKTAKKKFGKLDILSLEKADGTKISVRL